MVNKKKGNKTERARTEGEEEGEVKERRQGGQ